MTVIEFFNKTAIENMLSALLCQPERVIYIGYSNKQMRAAMAIYREVLDARCVDTELSFVNVNRNDLKAITEALDAVHNLISGSVVLPDDHQSALRQFCHFRGIRQQRAGRRCRWWW